MCICFRIQKFLTNTGPVNLSCECLHPWRSCGLSLSSRRTSWITLEKVRTNWLNGCRQRNGRKEIEIELEIGHLIDV